MMKKGVVDFITLGCSKNLVDAERLMRQLEAAGWCCVHDAAEPNGEIAVVNTCGFIGDAKEESINTILQLVARKARKQLRKLIVMGCLSERYRADLEAEIPEVDAYFGKFDYMDVVEWLGKYNPDRQKESICSYERKLTTPTHYAYLKISEGCNRMCSYCAIPLITGRHTSRPMEEMLDELEAIVFSGTKININYFIQEVVDPDEEEEIYEYFKEADNDSIKDAMEELGEDYYDIIHVRLVRIKFHCELGN